MPYRYLLALILSCSLLTACGGSSNSDDTGSSNPPPPPPAMVANFDPANGIIPFPNNLLFSGTTDLTLNIPVADPSNYGDPQVAMNALDGFSTVAPWSTTLSEKPAEDTLVAGTGIHVFEVQLASPAGGVTKVVRELQSPEEYVVALAPTDTSGKTLVIVPTKPLKPRTSYMVVLMDSITNAEGAPLTPSLTYTLAKGSNPLCVDGKSTSDSLTDAQACALEPVRQLVNSQEAAAAAAGIDRTDISLSWVATTQSTTLELQALTARIEAMPPAAVQIAPTGMTLGDLGLGLAPIADVDIGIMTVPYYLSAPTADDPTAPLTGFWHAAPGAYAPPADAFGLDPTSTNVTAYNPFPVATANENIPVLLTVPNAASGKQRPADGWPIVIFQHGITRNRTDMLAVAQTFASQGYAVIAIDLPLHGVNASSPFYIGNTPFGAIASERTFDIDVMNNQSGAAGPDGVPDASGAHFINLSSLLTSRDNVRQGVADLVELEHAIGTIDVNHDGQGDFDPDKVYFVGQSLGAIVGTVFIAVDDNVDTSVLNVPGGGLARLVSGSATIGPQIRAGLANAGVQADTPDYDAFMMATQTVIDAADPINYAPLAAGDKILLQEVIGGGEGDGKPLPDQVVPNTVEGAPLSGTEPLVAALGLEPITHTVQSEEGIRGVVRFLEGDHGSLLSPATAPAVTAEMQGEMASMVVSDGHVVQVANPSLIWQGPPSDDDGDSGD
ncbi:MAG TPA: hypothetical protein VFG73_07630 [Rhodanobacteraceae bacterium]|nr:hypothetical protein [Rhodanobacteraceae bacterium]